MSSQSATNWRTSDHEYMALALQLAKKGQFTARPNPMVGCVVVADGELVGQGWHQKSGEAHAEINALAEAGEQARGATCYVTLEPCAHYGKTGPCAEALIEAGVGRVVAAMQDPNPLVAGKGFDLLLEAGIAVDCGLLETQARALNPGFISAIERGRPWVTCKLAMSLDGRTAMADGSSKWITGSAARADVQKLRARQDAILTGIGTLSADNPSLTVREADTQPTLDDWFAKASKLGFTQPARILLDRQARAPYSAKFFADNAQVYWTTAKAPQEMPNSKVKHLVDSDDLNALLCQMPALGINQLLVEAGHKLAGAFVEQGLVDELIVYMAPKLMGNKAIGLLDLAIDNMTDCIDLSLLDVRHLGDDIRFTYKVKN